MTQTRQSAPRARRGFTFIEILFIVAVIATLAAIAVPNFLEAQVRSKVVAQGQIAANLAMALEAYRVDHRDYPPNVVFDRLVAEGSLQQAAALNVGQLTAAMPWLADLPPHQQQIIRDWETSNTKQPMPERDAGAYALARLNSALSLSVLMNAEPDAGGLTYLPPDVFNRSWGATLDPMGYLRLDATLADAAPNAWHRPVNARWLAWSAGPAHAALPVAMAADAPAVYDPTNGTVSFGTLIYDRHGAWSPAR